MAPNPTLSDTRMIHVAMAGGGWSVFQGLAAESLLADRPADAPPVLLVWRGPVAIVMGKNQNPWREVNLEEIQSEGIPLARRISGGGTVYHDPGNLNLSWVFPRESYRTDRVTNVLVRTLGRLGFSATPGVSGGLRIDGKKVSGTAFCYRRHHVLHHGTLLLSADLDRMRRVLSPPRLRIRTHAVRSIPAQVTNLADLAPDLTVDCILEALLAETRATFGPVEEKTPLADPSRHLEEARALETTAWIWDQTPAFLVHIDAQPSLSFRVRKGMTSNWSCDGGKRDDIPDLPFRRESIPSWANALDLSRIDLTSLLEQNGWRLP